MMYRTVTVTPVITGGTIRATPTISGNITAQAEVYTSVRSYGGEVDFYDGPYEFTPTQATQTVLIDSLTASQNITINPIPSNYGLIGWNGSVLTVS